MMLPVYKDVYLAHDRIRKFIHRTPVMTSESINKMAGCELYFKCENLQKVGAFKYRGATNAVLLLNKEEMKHGVATHSSGNHAQALALAALTNGVSATIVMPENAPKVKVDAVLGYKAEIIFCEPTLDARETTLLKVINEKSATFIHPYNDFNVIAGQGTAAKELIEDTHGLDFILAPVGGGGLLSGTSISSKSLLPDTKVIACEPAGADDAFKSFYSKMLIPQTSPKTVCDGLLTSLGEITFAIIQRNVDAVITAEDIEIIDAMKLIWQRMKLIIEPSSAVPLAVVLKNKELFAGSKVGIIISGGNIDTERKY